MKLIETEYTYAGLAKKWKCSKRTARRDATRFKLRPSRRRGLQPYFKESAVAAMEARRDAARESYLAKVRKEVPRGRIVSLREAKAIAARRGR